MTEFMWAVSGSDKDCPKLILDTDEGYASYDSDDGDIHISRIAIQKFENNLGGNADDAMATLIAHEIAHALRGDKNRPRFARWLDPDVKDAEKRADLCGLMLAHMSGFDSALVVFDKIFPTLGIRGGSNGYPGIEERLEHDTKVMAKSHRLVGVFDFANALLLTGDEDAIHHATYLYDYMATNDSTAAGVEFLELNYNQGMAALLLLVKMEGLHYALPLDVADPKLLLSAGAGQKFVEGKDELLKAARFYFEKVARAAKMLVDIGDKKRLRNETIFNAQLAKTCLYLLAGKPDEAQREAELLAARSEPSVWKDKALMVSALARLTKNKGDQSARNDLQKIESNTKNPATLRKYARFNLNAQLSPSLSVPPPCVSETSGLPSPNAAGKEAEKGKKIPLENGVRLAVSAPNWLLRGDRASLAFIMQAYPSCPCSTAELNGSEVWATGFGTYQIFPIQSQPDTFYVTRTDASSKKNLQCFRLTILEKYY